MTDPVQVYTDQSIGADTFAIPFDYLRAEDLRVYVDGVEQSWSFNGSTYAQLDTPLVAESDVEIRRTTVIDSPYGTFTQVLDTSTLNNTVLQLLYGLQELDYRLTNLDLTTLDPDYVPPATALDKMIISGSDGMGGFEWQVVDISSVVTGGGGGGTVPTASGILDDRFLMTDGEAWTVKTPEEVQAVLAAVGVALPSPVGSGSHVLMVNSIGDGYTLNSPSETRTALSLGSAATKNAGSASGQVLQLANAGDYGGTPGEGALPVIDKGGLQGVPGVPEYCQFSSSYPATFEYTLIDDDVFAYGTFDTQPSWASPFVEGADAFARGVTILEAGTYEFEAEVMLDGAAVDFALEINVGGVAVATSLDYFTFTGHLRATVKTVVEVAANDDVRVYARGTASPVNTIEYATGGVNTRYNVLHIKKLS